jgi:predicted nucleic acid-binding protein
VLRPLTIDSSVIVSALSVLEEAHQESRLFLESLGARERLLVLPTLARPEVAGAISRTTGDPVAARRAARLAFLPGPVSFVPLEERLAEEAAEIAAAVGLKGADAVYAAVARRFDAVLVTLDRDFGKKLGAAITCLLPGEVATL